MAEDKSVSQMQSAGAKVLQNTPGLAGAMASSGKTQAKNGVTGGGSDSAKDAMIADLMRQLESASEKNRSLEDEYKHRIASFVKRETQTKNKIESLERRLNEGTDQDDHMQRMAVIGNMHKLVVAGVECIQSNTAKILQDQERDLMHAFRQRLQEVSKEMEQQRNRKGEHSSELQSRIRRVVAELTEAQDLAQTFDKKNQALQEENRKLQEKLRTRDDDRQALLRELVLCRKETARLKAQFKDVDGGAASVAVNEESPEATAKPTFSQKQIEQARLQTTQNKQYEREVKYREENTKLKRMVEAERKSNRAFRQQQAEMLQQRTELEVLLRQCLDDVKSEIMRLRLENERKDGPPLPVPGQTVTSMSIHELTPQDRERVLELLLSQQRVVQLLYSKTFPTQLPVTEGGESPDMPSKQGGKEGDFSWLSDIMPPDR
jgi:hypothetical protein